MAEYFAQLNSRGYKSYLEEFSLHKILGIELTDIQENNTKVIFRDLKSKPDSIRPNRKNLLPPQLDDLIRLHFLVASRKVLTSLEFGVGYSTRILNHAIKLNQNNYKKNFETLRKVNQFEHHVVDNSRYHLKMARKLNLSNTQYHYSTCRMATFNGKICSLYSKLPNVQPNFIYIDGPDQFSPKGKIAGISTRSADRVPLAADVLRFEHFLLPKTLIVLDGRTANARFLKCNLQRNWLYSYVEDYDQHFFELEEAPLGPHNQRYIEECGL